MVLRAMVEPASRRQVVSSMGAILKREKRGRLRERNATRMPSFSVPRSASPGAGIGLIFASLFPFSAMHSLKG